MDATESLGSGVSPAIKNVSKLPRLGHNSPSENVTELNFQNDQNFPRDDRMSEASSFTQSWHGSLRSFGRNDNGDIVRLDCGLIVGALKQFVRIANPNSQGLYRIPAAAVLVLSIPLFFFCPCTLPP